MFAEGLRIIMNTAMMMLNFVVIPANAFGNHGAVSFWQVFVLGLGGVFLVKFVRYCMGGNFNEFGDKGKSK